MASINEKETFEIINKIEQAELSKLTLELAKIPSPRGYEKEVGDYLYEWMRKEGFYCFKQQVAENRYNVIGILKGDSGSPKLIFNAHMDTRLRHPDDVWIMGDDIKYYIEYEGKEEGEFLVGDGVVNDKGPMAAFLMAVKAIKDSGIKLEGDIIMTCVIGEIDQTPVDEFQGTKYEGQGYGTRHLITHGIFGDYAVVAECTNFSISRAEAGNCWFKINIYGKGGIYTPWIERPYRFEENPNSIYKASYVIQAIEEWAAEYEKRNSLEFEDGVIVPKVNIGAIRGGLPYRISQTPGVCSIYVDVRLNPTQSPLEVRKELESVIKKTGVEYTIENYLYHQGYIANNVDRLIESVKKAHERELGYPPKKVLTPYCSMWRDINVFNEYKIPAITYGPTAYVYKNIGRAGIRALKKQELLQVSKIYGLIALDICKGIHKK